MQVIVNKTERGGGKKGKISVFSLNLDDCLDPQNKCNNLSTKLIFQSTEGRASGFITGCV